MILEHLTIEDLVAVYMEGGSSYHLEDPLAGHMYFVFSLQAKVGVQCGVLETAKPQ